MSAQERLNEYQRKPRMRTATAVLIIAGSSYFSLLANVLRSVLIMRLVGPAPQGVRRLVDLALKYLTHSHLGILHGVNKELPIYVGKNEAEKIQEVEEVGATWILGLAAIASLGMLISGLRAPLRFSVTGHALLFGAGMLLVGQTYTLYRTMARVWGHFSALGIVSAIETIASFALTIGGAYGFYHWRGRYAPQEQAVLGAIAGGLLANMLALLLLDAWAPLRVHLRLAPQVAGRLIKVGLPIAAIIFADTFLRTVDGVVLSTRYSVYWFGLYSLAMQMANYLYALPEAAGFVLWPRILEAYGAANGNEQALQRPLWLPTLLAGLYMPVMAGLAYILLPPLIAFVLPQFTPAIQASQILCLASVFLALPLATNSLLIAQDKSYYVVAFKLIGAGLTGLGCLWLARADTPSLAAYAVMAMCGYAVAAVLSLGAALAPSERPGRRIVALMGLMGGWMWMSLVLWALRVFSRKFGWPEESHFVGAAIRLIVFSVLSLPLLWLGQRYVRLTEQGRLWRQSQKE